MRSKITFDKTGTYEVHLGKDTFYHTPCTRTYEDGTQEHGRMVQRISVEDGIPLVEHWFEGLTH